MSQANVDFVIKNNPEVSPQKVEICPNSIEIRDMRVDNETRVNIRQKYNLPVDKKIFVYGGNLGKPQGIDFLIDCLKSQKNNNDAFFLTVGDGTEYKKLEEFFSQAQPSNMCIMKRLPKEDYDRMIAACDVGMIFLDYKFTIPNFPSRLLAYMQAGLPVLACTDPNTDVGKVICDGGFGWWCESNNVSKFSCIVSEVLALDNLDELSDNSVKYLNANYSVETEYKIIRDSVL